MATAATAVVQLANELESAGLTAYSGEKIANHLAKMFSIRPDEVGILKLVDDRLVFIYPAKLHDVGSIPLTTNASVAARTATTRRAEIINNFSQVKHATFFESIDLGIKGTDEKFDKSSMAIQKLMTVPVINGQALVGVIQVSRKGANPMAAGADYMPSDLQKLVTAASQLAKCFK
jgi:hypothetical protein